MTILYLRRKCSGTSSNLGSRHHLNSEVGERLESTWCPGMRFPMHFLLSHSGLLLSTLFACAVNFAVVWHFLTVLTTSRVWYWTPSASTSRYSSRYSAERCFSPAGLCLQVGFDETNGFPDRHLSVRNSRISIVIVSVVVVLTVCMEKKYKTVFKRWPLVKMSQALLGLIV